MKYFSLVFVVLVLCLWGASPLSAQNTNSSLTPANRRQVAPKQLQNIESSRSGQLQQTRQQNAQRVIQQREQVLQRTDTNRAALQENRENRISLMAQAHADRLTRRFGFYYLRLSKLIDKIQTRLDVLATSGQDTTQAQNALDEASTMLEEANRLAQAAIAEFESAASESQSAAELSRSAAELAKQARAQFVEVVLQLRVVMRLVNQFDQS